jgi:hypothetical protein
MDATTTSVAGTPLDPKAHTPSRTSIKPLIAIVMLIATILTVIFDAFALVTVWQGPVAYQGIDFATRGSDVYVGAVTDPALYREGVRVGQRATWQGRSAWRAMSPRPDDVIEIQSPGGAVTIRASRAPFSSALKAVAFAMVIGALAVLVFAGVLCYQRPGVMTVALWLFVAFNFNIGWLMNIYSQLPEAAARPIVVFILAVAGGWSYYPLVWFALRFPDDKIRSQPMRSADYLWSIVSFAALVWFVVDSARGGFGLEGVSADVSFWRYTLPQNLPSLVGLAAFLWVYVRSDEAARQRLLWAIVGFVLMIVFELVGNFATETTPTLFPTRYLLGNAALMLAAFCPLALLYAVFRHRLLDISFVVNRALVYSALTALIVLVVGSVDWIAGKYLFESHAALVVEAGVTIGLGFVLQRIHGVLERAVDRVIFARRHAAEQHIERVIAGLAFARTHGAILRAVVEDPHLALELVSCAIFIDDGKALTLECNFGWKLGETTKIERDDPLARLLLSERRVMGIAEAHWKADIVAHAPGSLDVAVPLFARNDLRGIALYGRHRNGTAIDPEERKLLHRLCEAAAVAYEAVALAEAREELAATRSLTRLGAS